MSLPTAAEIARAAEVLRKGGLVAFPTETVYGLGADASSPDALRRLYAVKGRPADHPVIVHLASVDQLADWAATVTPDARALAATFWPGPLTLVLPRRERVPDEVTGRLPTVALRVPDQPVALRLLREFGGGVAAPSANRFGRVSPTSARDVRADLGDDVDVILDDGPCRVGVESTIVDCTGGEITILRLGGVARERVEGVLGRAVPIRTDGSVRAPGTLSSHYAPSARVEVVDASDLVARAHRELERGVRIGVLASKLPHDLPSGAVVDRRAGRSRRVRALAVPAVARRRRPASRRAARGRASEVGIGAAVGDRLRRAAGSPDA